MIDASNLNIFLPIAISLAILQAILLLLTVYEKGQIKGSVITSQKEKRLLMAASMLLIGIGASIFMGLLVQISQGSLVIDYTTVLLPLAAIVLWYLHYSKASNHIDLGVTKGEVRAIYQRWVERYILDHPKETFTAEKIYKAIRLKQELVEDIYQVIPEKATFEALFPKEYLQSFLSPLLIDKAGIRDILNQLTFQRKLVQMGDVYQIPRQRAESPPPTPIS